MEMDHGPERDPLELEGIIPVPDPTHLRKVPKERIPEYQRKDHGGQGREAKIKSAATAGFFFSGSRGLDFVWDFHVDRSKRELLIETQCSTVPSVIQPLRQFSSQVLMIAHRVADPPFRNLIDELGHEWAAWLPPRAALRGELNSRFGWKPTRWRSLRQIALRPGHGGLCHAVVYKHQCVDFGPCFRGASKRPQSESFC